MLYTDNEKERKKSEIQFRDQMQKEKKSTLYFEQRGGKSCPNQRIFHSFFFWLVLDACWVVNFCTQLQG